jgi:two-component system cell cycle sensor histidine kinase/response regulator CckA
VLNAVAAPRRPRQGAGRLRRRLAVRRGAAEGGRPLHRRIVEANPALAAVALGGEPGQIFGELLEPASRLDAAMRLADAAHGHAPLEVRLAHDPTRIAHLYLSGRRRPLGRLSGGRLRAEAGRAAASQDQKMQAIGQLAGGVAHDFNNLLTAILMQLDVLASRHPVGDPSYEGLNEIRQTSNRAADLVRKLLAFSRKQTVQREILDLGELISESQVLLRRLLYEDVKLETDFGRDLPLVRADKSQLETAVMNLAVNARDAVRAHGGGTVRIRAARVSALQGGRARLPGRRRRSGDDRGL